MSSSDDDSMTALSPVMNAGDVTLTKSVGGTPVAVKYCRHSKAGASACSSTIRVG